MQPTETEIANGILAEISTLAKVIASQAGGCSTLEQQITRKNLIDQYRDFLDAVEKRAKIEMTADLMKRKEGEKA